MGFDYTGTTFGNLIAIKKVNYKDKYDHIYWLCRCSCENEEIFRTDHLVNGSTTKCSHCSGKKRRNSELYQKLNDALINLTTENNTSDKSRIKEKNYHHHRLQ